MQFYMQFYMQNMQKSIYCIFCIYVHSGPLPTLLMVTRQIKTVAPTFSLSPTSESADFEYQ